MTMNKEMNCAFLRPDRRMYRKDSATIIKATTEGGSVARRSSHFCAVVCDGGRQLYSGRNAFRKGNEEVMLLTGHSSVGLVSE